MLHYREMGILLNSGNWVHIIKKVVYIAIYTYIIPSIFMYLKLTSVNWGRKDDKLNGRSGQFIKPFSKSIAIRVGKHIVYSIISGHNWFTENTWISYS